MGVASNQDLHYGDREALERLMVEAALEGRKEGSKRVKTVGGPWVVATCSWGLKLGVEVGGCSWGLNVVGCKSLQLQVGEISSSRGFGVTVAIADSNRRERIYI